MNKPRDGLDLETAELVDRFESIYASMATPDEVGAAPPAAAPGLFVQDFEFPADLDARDDDAAHKKVDEIMERVSVVHAEPDSVDEPDIDEAFAILRGSEMKARSADAGRVADADIDANAARDVRLAERVETKAEPHSNTGSGPTAAARALKSYRRYAVPALAVTLFVGLASGYAVTHHDKSPGAAASSAVPSAPLKLDYALQPARPDALAARRSR